MKRRSLDLGGGHVGGFGPPWLKHVLLGVLILMVIVSVRAIQISNSAKTAKDWIVAGPPCPTSAAYAAPLKYAADFNEAHFARRFGTMECSVVKDKRIPLVGHADVCRFSSPDLLEVTTAKGVFPFAPGPGEPATVKVVSGEASCVISRPPEPATRPR